MEESAHLGKERSRTPEPPYCWQNKEARRMIRNRLDGDSLQRIALAVYDALTEIASNSSAETFTASQPYIGTLAGGYEVRSLQRVLPLLRDMNLIHYNTPTGKLRGPITYRILAIASDGRNDTTRFDYISESQSRSNKGKTNEKRQGSWGKAWKVRQEKVPEQRVYRNIF